MALEHEVAEVQRLYPLIYVTCHKEHVRAVSSHHLLSARDCSILAHLSADQLTTPSNLARHLSVALPTLSEAVSRLVELGYILSKRDENDERKRKLVLTSEGMCALKNASVLDPMKVAKILSKLTPKERKTAIEGLSLLAHAAFPEWNEITRV